MVTPDSLFSEYPCELFRNTLHIGKWDTVAGTAFLCHAFRFLGRSLSVLEHIGLVVIVSEDGYQVFHFGFFILVLRDNCPSPVEESSHHRSFMFQVMLRIKIQEKSV